MRLKTRLRLCKPRFVFTRSNLLTTWYVVKLPINPIADVSHMENEMKLRVLYNCKGKAWFGMLNNGYFHAWIRWPFLDHKP